MNQSQSFEQRVRMVPDSWEKCVERGKDDFENLAIVLLELYHNNKYV